MKKNNKPPRKLSQTAIRTGSYPTKGNCDFTALNHLDTRAVVIKYYTPAQDN